MATRFEPDSSGLWLYLDSNDHRLSDWLFLPEVWPAKPEMAHAHPLSDQLQPGLCGDQPVPASYCPEFPPHLYTFLILPLVFIGSQGLISYLYPSNRFSPLATAIVYQIINGFVGQGFISWTTFLYLALAYGTLYLIVVKIKKGEWDRNR